VEGRFQHDLCSCANVCCRGLWWNSFLCGCVPFAQLLNRLKLNPCGNRAADGPSAKSCTFGTVVGVATVGYFFFWLAARVFQSSPGGAAILYLISMGLMIWLIVLATRARMSFRRHFKIPGDCFGDCCCMYWCCCCNVTRMIRQTHDEDTYKYQCCNLDGLPSHAPELAIV
jgi:Cys-rich protein (TIGR01571 family)